MTTDDGPASWGKPAGVALFLAGYALAVALSERAYGSLAVPSPFWLPDSVLLVALLLTPPARWWIFLAAMWPVRLLAGAPAGTPLWFVLASGFNDALKAAGTAWLLGRVARRPIRLDSLNDFLLFLAIAGSAVPLLSALAAAPTRYALGDPTWPATYKWFLGDVLAQVVVTPTLLFWCTAGYRQLKGRGAEFCVLMTLLAAAAIAAFVLSGSVYSTTLLYAPVPFLVWAAVRLRPFGTANAITLVAVILMVGAVRGAGAFANDTADQSVLSLQLFLLALAVPLLSLATLTAERERLRQREIDFNSRLLEAQDRERARIARDLHDDFAQRMAMLHIGLTTFGRGTPLSGSAEQELKALATIVDRMSSDLRDLSHRLHPETLDIIGLENAMRTLCAELESQHTLRVELLSRDVPMRLEADIAIGLFRIAQEALRNVVRHSGASQARVELSCDAERLVLSVSDDGVGFDADEEHGHAGLGLISMRERLRPIAGRLFIESTPGVGTRVRADVPIRIGDARAGVAEATVATSPFSPVQRHQLTSRVERSNQATSQSLSNFRPTS